MLINYPEISKQILCKQKVKMKDRQIPLCNQYIHDPRPAVITDSAKTLSSTIPASNPLNTEIVLGKQSLNGLPVGLHPAVGGDGDCQNPGDILCGAIASCFDLTLRVVANRSGVKLKTLEVEVNGTVDVRGTLRVNSTTPISFQKFDIQCNIETSVFVPSLLLRKLVRIAERSCVVIQTLRPGTEVEITIR